MRSGDEIEFTVIGKSDGYVAIGFGDNSQMEGIKSTICAKNGAQVDVYNAYNGPSYTSDALEVKYFSSTCIPLTFNCCYRVHLLILALIINTLVWRTV